MTRRISNASGSSPMAERCTTPEVILFDLGGVLVELGPHPLPPDLDIPLARCFESRAVADFEKGFIGADEFGRAIVEEFAIEADAASIVEHFRRWPAAPFPGALELLSRLREQFKIAILSNTNELHWSRFDTEFGLFDQCDQAFASHLLGMLKPSAEIFEHVTGALDTAAQRILFLDDNPANVAAARSAGMQAEQVRGSEGAVCALAARGIDPAGAACGKRAGEVRRPAS